jgi:hypothetical protein
VQGQGFRDAKGVQGTSQRSVAVQELAIPRLALKGAAKSEFLVPVHASELRAPAIWWGSWVVLLSEESLMERSALEWSAQEPWT